MYVNDHDRTGWAIARLLCNRARPGEWRALRLVDHRSLARYLKDPPPERRAEDFETVLGQWPKSEAEVISRSVNRAEPLGACPEVGAGSDKSGTEDRKPTPRSEPALSEIPENDAEAELLDFSFIPNAGNPGAGHRFSLAGFPTPRRFPWTCSPRPCKTRASSPWVNRLTRGAPQVRLEPGEPRRCGRIEFAPAPISPRMIPNWVRSARRLGG